MVDRRRRSGAADPSTEPTVASILGLSGPIRFRLHGSSQKAHLVLRRVSVPDDSTDDENVVSGPPTTAFYSLFAQKRIEVKPGKEILLAIEGEFSDRPVLIGGDLPVSQHDDESLVMSPPSGKGSHAHDLLTVAKDRARERRQNTKPYSGAIVTAGPGEIDQDMPLTVPPKMRKLWVKGRQCVPESEPVDVPLRPAFSLKGEMGVQAQPDYSSVFIEATPIPGLSCGVQTFIETPVYESQHTEKSTSTTLDANTKTQSQETPGPTEQLQPNTESESEDSLSPMEISSTPSTPEQEPSKVPRVSPPSIHVDPVLSPKDPVRAVLPTERPFSPSSSASSVPDELDIRLITDEPKQPVKPDQTVPSSSHLRSSRSPSIPPVNQPYFNSDSRTTPILPIQVTTTPAPTTADSKVNVEHTSGNRSVTESPWKVPESVAYWEAPSPYDSRSRPSSSHSGRVAPDMSVFRKHPDVDMYSLWGSTSAPATGAWGSPPLANSSRPIPSSTGSGARIPPGIRQTPTPADLKLRMNLQSGPIDNPMGSRPSGIQMLQRQAGSPLMQPSTMVLSPVEVKKGPVVGSDWPPRSRGYTPANGSSHFDQHVSESSFSIFTGNDTPSTWPSPHSYPPELSCDSDGKLKRENADNTASFAPRKRTGDSALAKPEPLTDPSTSMSSAGGLYSNGKPPLQPPTFVGYTPPTKPFPVPFPVRDPGFQSETSPRGIKRSAPSGFDTSSSSASPVTPSRPTFRWPTQRPMHTAQVQGIGADIQFIAFNSDGSQFAVCCLDYSVRIWNNVNHIEMAKLAHVAPVVSVAWMDDDLGVVTLSDTGEVSKWTRVGGNQWHWAKLLDTSSEHRPGTDPTSFAYMNDRIAIAFPRVGVKVWLWVKGMWQPQRSILRQNVTSIKFVEEGEALLGGTDDGVLWYCQIPNGTLRAYSFFKTGVYFLDVNSSGSHSLVSRKNGFAHLVSVVQDDRKGRTDREYPLNDEAPGASAHGATFTNWGQTVVFGEVQGCVLVWDKDKVVWGLDHGDNVSIQAIANFNPRRDAPEGHLITGTKSGVLSWWDHPPGTTGDSNKRVRVL